MNRSMINWKPYFNVIHAFLRVAQIEDLCRWESVNRASAEAPMEEPRLDPDGIAPIPRYIYNNHYILKTLPALRAYPVIPAPLHRGK